VTVLVFSFGAVDRSPSRVLPAEVSYPAPVLGVVVDDRLRTPVHPASVGLARA
jgi:hypothetical protein